MDKAKLEVIEGGKDEAYFRKLNNQLFRVLRYIGTNRRAEPLSREIEKRLQRKGFGKISIVKQESKRPA